MLQNSQAVSQQECRSFKIFNAFDQKYNFFFYTNKNFVFMLSIYIVNILHIKEMWKTSAL